jgi:hypothetical protein
MSNIFKVGEKVIVVRSKSYPELIGREVTILEPLRICRNEGRSWFAYTVDYGRDEYVFCPPPHYLRRKTDGDGPLAHDVAEKGSWDKVGWSPTKDLMRQ